MEIDIDILRGLCNNKAIKWTEHIALRMLKRQISRRQIIAAMQSSPERSSSNTRMMPHTQAALCWAMTTAASRSMWYAEAHRILYG